MLFDANYKVIIKPRTFNLYLDLRELWQYRELFYIFAWRDIKVRYKQTFLGIAWVVLQPLTTMLIFTIFFGKLAKIPSGNLPYSLFVLTGLVFWGFFSTILTHSTNSLVENENIIKKIYFPRIILPLSAIVTALVDFIIAFILLMIVSLYFGFVPSLLSIIIVPISLLIISTGAAGLGLLLSSFNVKYRDVRYILPFLFQTLLFLSPVIYPSALVNSSYRWLLAINPMTGVIESVRKVISGSDAIDYQLLVISLVSALFIFIIGLIYFRSTERFIADVI